ncbi:MAG: hypothetical protein AABZ53_08700 [Planctomycetota bacterium]
MSGPILVRVLLSCPVELEAEKNTLASVLDMLRPKFAKVGVTIETVRHETHSGPGLSEGPMQAIGQQMLAAPFELYVGLLRDRLGAGTIQELDLARARASQHSLGLPVVFLYLLRIDGELPPAVRQFESRFPGLCCEVDGVEDLRALFSAHLVDFLLGVLGGNPQSNAFELPRPWADQLLEGASAGPLTVAVAAQKRAAIFSGLRAACAAWLRTCNGVEVDALIAACSIASSPTLSGSPGRDQHIVALAPLGLAEPVSEVVQLYLGNGVHTSSGPVVSNCRCDMLAALLRWGCLLAVPWGPPPDMELAAHVGMRVLERHLRKARAWTRANDVAPFFGGAAVQPTFVIGVNRDAPVEEGQLLLAVMKRLAEYEWKRVLLALHGAPIPAVTLQAETSAPKLSQVESDALRHLLAALEKLHERFLVEHFAEPKPSMACADFLPLPVDTFSGPVAIAGDTAKRYRITVEHDSTLAQGEWASGSQLALDPRTWPEGRAVKWTLEREGASLPIRRGIARAIGATDRRRLGALRGLGGPDVQAEMRRLGLNSEVLAELWAPLSSGVADEEDRRWALQVLFGAWKWARLNAGQTAMSDAYARAWDICNATQGEQKCASLI